MTTFKKASLAASVLAASMMASAGANALAFDQNVTPDVIFGDGNANGGFTVDTAGNIEVGLRGKLRHNADGQPENTFNSNGDGTYTFNPGIAPEQNSPTAEWSFEWSVNTNLPAGGLNQGGGDGGSSLSSNLSNYTYLLQLDSNPAVGEADFFVSFDPITWPRLVGGGSTVNQWDHAIGNNSTVNGGGSVVSNGSADEAAYANLLANNNVAQNSWKPHWFINQAWADLSQSTTGAPSGTVNFDPTVSGEYEIRLSVFGGEQDALASTSIFIQVGELDTPPNGDVPVPGTLALFGLGLLGTAATRRRLRRQA
jgi:hypothetical protein